MKININGTSDLLSKQLTIEGRKNITIIIKEWENFLKKEKIKKLKIKRNEKLKCLNNNK